MVTRILFDPRRDTPTGTITSSPVTVECTPTGIREDGAVVIYPTKIVFTISTSADVLQLPPNLASTAWRLVTIQSGVILQQRTVRVPDQASVTWQALPDVDPASLAVTSGTARQWDAMFWQIQQQIGQLAVGGNGGAQVLTQSSPSASWIFSHALGRIPVVAVFDPTGEQVVPDVHASSTSISLVFANPLAGIAVLT